MRLEEITQNLNKKVKLTNRHLYLENEEFLLTSCVVWKDKKGMVRYSVEVTELANCRSVIRCRIEDIEAAE